jgi:hypothetical protein
MKKRRCSTKQIVATLKQMGLDCQSPDPSARRIRDYLLSIRSNMPAFSPIRFES